MALQVYGELKIVNNDQESFASCVVVALVDRKSAPTASESPSETEPIAEMVETSTAAEVPIPFQVSALCDAAGDFTLIFPSTLDISAMRVQILVLSPRNNKLLRKELGIGELNTSRESPITLIVERFDVPLAKPTEPEPPPTRRIRGRVIERRGKSLPACIQVLLLGSEKEAGNDDLIPVLVTKADSTGYFLGTIKNSQYKKVVALVAGVANEMEVRLVESRVPPHIPIVVELPDQPKNSSSNDCKCSNTSDVPRTPTQDEVEEMCGVFSADLGTNQCIRFNVPNRAIEEFNFYSVIRTTDPIIKGITIDPHDRDVAIPTIPPAQGEGNPKGGGGATPPSPPDPRFLIAIQTSIRTALSGSNRLVTRHTWANVEQLIRDAVTNAGGSPLPGTFFQQFSGWGQEEVWGEGYDALDGGWKIRNLIRFEPVIMAASLAGAGGARDREIVATVSPMVTGAASQALTGVSIVPFWPEYRLALLREPLDSNNQVDWDDTPTFYQAVSIAHGHLLHFKQVWYADGYSLGDLIESLPLAPGQKKLISIIDWERREQASRQEFTTAEEGLNAALARDRDLREVVSGTLSETSRGESHNKTEGFGIGKGSAGSGSYNGFNFGGVMGVSGGTGSSVAGAFQQSARNLASSSLQTLRDRTLQSASAVRSLRSTIVQTVAQGETVRATTDVIANHNHCHALTIQYFEVLRHFKVTNELADAQECLFVPLPMGAFNRAKVLRWRESLLRYLKRPELGPAINATERIETNWKKEYTPQARYADENVTAIFGELTLTIYIPLPPFPEKPKPKPGETLEQTAEAARKAMAPAEDFLRIALAIGTLGTSEAVRATTQTAVNVTKAVAQGAHALAESLSNEPSAEERYARFQQEVMPGAAAGFVDQLELYALVGTSEMRLNGADFTLVSEYHPGTPLLVSVRGRITTPVTRASIAALVIKSGVPLPAGCRVIVNSTVLRYQTDRFRHDMINDQRVNDDIDLPIVAGTGTPDVPALPIPPLPGFPTKWTQIPGVTPIRNGNGAMLYTPLDEWEQRAPRLEDIRLSAELITHLNENLEYYHHAIWWAMDPNRRYMLLDRYAAPNGGGRSVASVVDNTLIGMVGNSLILPVALGNRLEPTFKLASNATLLEHYDPQSPAPPSRVSLPTRGVFAEAVMGDCNACEEIDDSRFWRWEESPIDEPPALDMAALASRRSEPNFGTPTPFPTPMVNIQNAPQAPDPTGVRAALDTLAKQSFADITGLAGTQANAAAAFSKAMDTALAFGKEASQLAQQASMTKNIGQTMKAIDKAEGENKIDEGAAKQLRTSALKTMTGDTQSDPKAASVADRLKVIDDQVTKGSLSEEQALQRRVEILKGLEPEDIANMEERRAATEAIRRIADESIESVDTGTTKVTARPSGSNQGGGSGGGLLDEALQMILGANPGLLRNPIIAFDPANPRQEAQTAFAKMVADDPLGTATRARLESYIDTFGFDRAENPTIRGQGIREPWQSVTLSDLDAVIAVGNALGVPASQVLAVWISEGKLPHNAVLHGGAMDDAREKAEFAGASLAQVRAFARSLLLFNTFGADPMTAFAPRGGLGGDNLLLGPKNGHNAAFDSSIDSIRAAGVPGFQNRSNADIRDFFTTVGGGLVASHIVGAINTDPDVVRVRITDSSLASWLWLQAALFEMSRVKLEREFAALYPGTAVDLRGRPWVTYLFWNTNKTPAVAQQFYGGAASAEGAIANRFGSSNTAPSKLNTSQLDRYYARGANAAAGQSTAAWANAVMVKFLVETVQSWFQ